MRRVKRFVQTKKREVEEELAKLDNGSPPDELLMRTLEGRLEAFELISSYLERLEEQDILLKGSGSAFSPQG